MEKIEVLDNLVWHAMTSGNKSLARGGELAKSFVDQISPFVGLKDFSNDAFKELELLSTEKTIAIVTREFVTPTESFEVVQREKILQMIFNGTADDESHTESIRLNKIHVPLMLELTNLTKPGPFLNDTLRFGNYFGIFESGRLAAMAGRRFHAGDYIEISAVCTHPDFSGRGYASKLMLDEASRILAENSIPYLHVRPNNGSAIRLYQKLGFDIHQEVNLLILKRAS